MQREHRCKDRKSSPGHHDPISEPFLEVVPDLWALSLNIRRNNLEVDTVFGYGFINFACVMNRNTKNMPLKRGMFTILRGCSG